MHTRPRARTGVQDQVKGSAGLSERECRIKQIHREGASRSWTATARWEVSRCLICKACGQQEQQREAQFFSPQVSMRMQKKNSSKKNPPATSQRLICKACGQQEKQCGAQFFLFSLLLSSSSCHKSARTTLRACGEKGI